MNCDDDVKSCYDDVTGDWTTELQRGLLYITFHYMDFLIYLKIFE